MRQVARQLWKDAPLKFTHTVGCLPSVISESFTILEISREQIVHTSSPMNFLISSPGKLTGSEVKSRTA